MITVDGAEVVEYEDISDTAKVTIKDGVVMFKGETSPNERSPSMETYFRNWKKKQSTIFLSVECPREKYEAVTLAIKAAGGKFKG